MRARLALLIPGLQECRAARRGSGPTAVATASVAAAAASVAVATLDVAAATLAVTAATLAVPLCACRLHAAASGAPPRFSDTPHGC